MSCSLCPHCQTLLQQQLADLILPPRPKPGGRAGVDRSFYKAFGMAYEAARARFSQPGVKIRQANPWMTANQYRVYLKRAREFGLLTDTAAPVAGSSTPAPAPAAPVAEQAPQQAPEEDYVDPEAGFVDTRPEWMHKFPIYLDAAQVQWLWDEQAVSTYDFATVVTIEEKDAMFWARLYLKSMADEGLGTYNGTTFRLTTEGPPARSRGGRPRSGQRG